MASATRRQETCHCSAYTFPHRLDGGDCSPDSRVQQCPHCRGYGVLPSGPFGEEPECHYCGGSGEVPGEADRYDPW